MEAGQEKIDKYPGRITLNLAKRYEEYAVPALFEPWTPKIADAARIQPGYQVLDVACGTGILTRYLDESRKARVIGIDPSEAMLSVASSAAPQIRWDEGRAELLPYANNSFDAVVSQFGISFFQNAEDAIKEMIRVVRPGKYIAVSVWNDREASPIYQAFKNLASKHLGEKLVQKLSSPFSWNKQKLISLFLHPGIHFPEITTLKTKAHFSSIEAWVYAEIQGWFPNDLVSDPALEDFILLAEKELAQFKDARGAVEFATSAHIATTVKEQLD